LHWGQKYLRDIQKNQKRKNLRGKKKIGSEKKRKGLKKRRTEDLEKKNGG
jgi:hypothetical protein